MESTKKKLAIVTGAARGIGLATAKLFSQNDYKVAIVDRDKNELSNLSLANNSMKSFCYDISDFNNVDMMYQEILEWHDRVDVLVNNAGSIFDKRSLNSEGIETATYTDNKTEGWIDPFMFHGALKSKAIELGADFIKGEINSISEIKAKDQTLLLGTDYGFLPQIISNYSYNELSKIINLKYQYDIATGNINSNVSKIYSSDFKRR